MLGSLRISLVQVILTFVFVGVILVIRIVLALHPATSTSCQSKKQEMAANHPARILDSVALLFVFVVCLIAVLFS